MGVSAALVRGAREADAAELARLVRQLGYNVSAAEIVKRLPLLERPGQHVLLAELDNAIVGCVTTSMMHVLHRPAPVGRISMMVVNDGSRGEGIGAALVVEAELRLLADGCHVVEVTSNLALAQAHGFYEAVGYERTSVRFARELSRARSDRDG